MDGERDKSRKLDQNGISYGVAGGQGWKMGQTNHSHPHPTPLQNLNLNLTLNPIPSHHFVETKKENGAKKKNGEKEKEIQIGASRQRGEPHSFSSPYSSSRTDSTTQILKDGKPLPIHPHLAYFLSPFAHRSSPLRRAKVKKTESSSQTLLGAGGWS